MKCIIVEDEYPAREELKYFVQNFSSIELEGEFENGMEVLKYLEREIPDVIFMDINIPGMDGMSLARIIKNLNSKPKIIFITAYREYAVEAFEIEAYSYILKPYSEEKIIGLLQRLESELEVKLQVEKFEKIALWNGEKMIMVEAEEILFCEAMEKETIVHTDKFELRAHMGFNDLMEKLPNDIFYKTHRSYSVNKKKVKEIIPWFNNTLMIKCEGSSKEVPVSRSRVKEFKKIMGI